jgi:Xaa-Pro dipeptidase
MPESHARRRASLRTRLRESTLDAFLVTDLLNIRYLTGFTGSNGALLLAAGADDDTGTVLCTDGRYEAQAGRQTPDLELLIERASALALVRRASEESTRYRRTGFESHRLAYDDHRVMAEAVEGVELVRAPGLVEEQRLVKDRDEIESLRAACAAADQALADMIATGAIRVGRTEREIARDLENLMYDHGAAAPSFESIVAAGANSAVPHHRPTDTVLVEGDFVKLDFGALVDGYHSDMTRTLVLGEPADWQVEIYQLVATAQAAGCTAVAPGARTADVDRAARAVIEEAGYGDLFVHGLGHGVGLQIHEAPSLVKSGTGTLAEGMTVTVEPGVYLAGKGGVRIEDTLVVRGGEPELLTLTAKDLVVI